MPKVLEDNWDDLTEEHLQKLIDDKYAEGYKVEYKREFVKDIGKSVASFANTHGGWIVIGMIEDEKTNEAKLLKPGELTKNPEGTLYDRCSNIDPIVYFETHVIYKDKKNNKGYIVVKVPESKDTPHFYKGIIYVRDGVKSEPVKEDRRYQIEKLFEKSDSFKNSLFSWYSSRQEFIESLIISRERFAFAVTFIPTNNKLVESDIFDECFKEELMRITVLERWLYLQDSLLLSEFIFPDNRGRYFSFFTNGAMEFLFFPYPFNRDELLNKNRFKNVFDKNEKNATVLQDLRSSTGKTFIDLKHISCFLDYAYFSTEKAINKFKLTSDFYLRIHFFNSNDVSLFGQNFFDDLTLHSDRGPSKECFSSDVYVPTDFKRFPQKVILGKSLEIRTNLITEIERAFLAFE